MTFSKDKITAALPADSTFRQITVYDTLPSTNTALKEAAKSGACHGTVFLAAHQSAGRGRLSRRFHSPRGSGLYLSLLVRPTIDICDAPLLTPLAAVAGARAIARISGRAPDIKWVNDLLFGKRKVAGILCESGLDAKTGALAYAVIGIGINLRQADYPPEIAEIATSLEAVTGKRLDGNRLAAAFLSETEALLRGLDSRTFLADYRARCVTVGQEITVMTEPPYTARSVGLDDRCGLIIEAADGTRRVLQSGEVSVKGR